MALHPSPRHLGQPTIESFTCNGFADSVILTGKKTLAFAWFVANADRVKIDVSTSATGSAASAVPRIPSTFVADPHVGSLTLSPTALTSLLVWNARFTLTATNKQGAVQKHIDVSAAESNIALVCVGGGIRSSFDLGAVAYLRAFLPQAPRIFAGSGFGALTAVGAAANWSGPSAFELLWNNFLTPLDSLYSFGPPITELFGSHADPVLFNSFYDSARGFAETVGLGLNSRFSSPVSDPVVDPGAIWMSTFAQTAFDLGKDAVTKAAGDALESAGVSLPDVVPIAVLLEIVVKWAVQYGIQKSHANLVQDILGASSMVSAAPMAKLIEFFTDSLAQIQANQAKLRIPLSDLEAGAVHYANELGFLYPRGGFLGAPVSPKVAVETILSASVAFPGWVPAVKIGDDNYVDGSLLDAAPVGAAIDAGADSVIVLQPNQRALRPATSFDGSSMMAISKRADMMWETGNLDARSAPFEGWDKPPGAWNATMTYIEATMSLLHLTAVDGDVGLKNIWADYGYMRAFDVLAPQVILPKEGDWLVFADTTDFLKRNSDLITALRYNCWWSECNLEGEMPLSYLPRVGPSSELITIPDGTAASAIREGKLKIRQALIERLSFVQQIATGRPFPNPPAVPPDASLWFQNFEHHPWIFEGFVGSPMNPWSALGGFATGDVPAAPVPPPLPNNLFLPLP